MKVYGNHRGTLLVIAVGDAVVEIEPRLKIEPHESQLLRKWEAHFTITVKNRENPSVFGTYSITSLTGISMVITTTGDKL